MKCKNIILFLLSILLVNCSDDDGVNLSHDDFKNVSYEETTLDIRIGTGQEWTATSLVPWLAVSEKEGQGESSLKVLVQRNVGPARVGKIVIWTPDGDEDIDITQAAAPEGEEFHYVIPVVFHVLYKDDSEKVPVAHFQSTLDKINRFYRGEAIFGDKKGVNMNLEFVLASTTPDGQPTDGIDYIKVADNEIECQKLMGDKKYIPYLWDHNRYMNVMIYPFKQDTTNGMILGVSHMPFSVRGEHELPGLDVVRDAYLTTANLPYPKCVSLNAAILFETTEAGAPLPNPKDFSVTAAHEFGHYLGLHHSFNEDASGQCVDSDFCEDTPPYDRQYYLRAYLPYLAANNLITTENLVKRTNCLDDSEFDSYNIMDYEYSFQDRFTPDQRIRIRNVLMYSPLIPGPKVYPAERITRSLQGEIELPMTIVQ